MDYIKNRTIVLKRYFQTQPLRKDYKNTVVRIVFKNSFDV